MHCPSNIRLFLLVQVFLFAFLGCKQSGQSQTPDSTLKVPVAKNIQTGLVAMDSVFVINYVQREPEFKNHEQLVRLFYRDRGWKLGWFKDGQLLPQAGKFMDVISHAKEEGLDPKNYRVKDYEQMFKAYESSQNEDEKRKLQQEIDVALTASYFNYGSDFYRGIVDPRTNGNINWKVKENKIKLNKALQTILKERESRYPYYEFEPLHEEYNRLRIALKNYREVQEKGGWPQIGEVKNLKLGSKSPEVANVWKRLMLEFNPKQADSISAKTDTVFDRSLNVLVKKFQKLHGLNPDGVVGGETLKELNVPLDERIDQLIINMERWRWIPKRFEEKYILVNIPEYTMHVRENEKDVFTMKVIVGEVMNSTPIFSDMLEYIVFSPYWNVPNNIVEKEIKPHMLRNPNFLKTQDMELLNGQGMDAKVIPASSINWHNVTSKNFSYLVRQRPGTKNSLGLVKFLFPNNYNVYLHGTPFESLFSQEQRGFSHGCIRLEEPTKLAEYLLRNNKEWDNESIKEAMHSQKQLWVSLKEKLPVYIVYFTSWVDENGDVHFRNDLYGHDENLKNEYFN